MHAIQTSGNCIRNITSDHLAGVAADELADPRPYARSSASGRRSTRIQLLPRKFKIAVTASAGDRAAASARCRRTPQGGLMVPSGSRSWPAAASAARHHRPGDSRISAAIGSACYSSGSSRVQRHGRRDNIHKARIKILVRALGVQEFRRQVEAEFEAAVNSRRACWSGSGAHARVFRAAAL